MRVLSCPLETVSVLLDNPYGVSYVCPALEHNRVMAWSFGVCKCADGLGGFVVEAFQHFVQVLGAECLQKPFAAGKG